MLQNNCISLPSAVQEEQKKILDGLTHFDHFTWKKNQNTPQKNVIELYHSLSLQWK